MVFQKGVKLKATESWRMNGQNSEEVDNFNCLGVTMESTQGWNKLKTQTETKGYQTITAIDKCVLVTPSIKVQILDNMYQMVCESKIKYKIEVWGLNEARKEIDKVHSRFGKILLDILNLQNYMN